MASTLGGWLGSGIGPHLRKHKQVMRNLGVVYPDSTRESLAPIARGIWRNLGSVLFEYPHLGRIYRDRIQVSMAPETRDLFKRGVPIVVITGHLANWEIIGSYLGHVLPPMTAVYGPQKNPWIDRLLQTFRRATACRFVSKKEVLRLFGRQEKLEGSIGFMLDVRVDTGNLLPFFGVDAPTTTSPARLALRLGHPLVPVRVKREGAARFELEFLAPLTVAEPTSVKRDAIELTQQFNCILEQWILERPCEWLCTKRRWPASMASISSSTDDVG